MIEYGPWMLADDLIARVERELADAAPGDAGRVADAILDDLARRNQFAASEPSLAGAVRTEIERLFASRDIAACKTALAKVFRDALGPSPREVTSASYSPELQLEVLGLKGETLQEPILDVGCGPEARLVRFLREHGKEATGIDVRAPKDATRASWLEYDYGAGRFGTIASHLGFTLHFMHQEMKRSDLAYEYARAYMRILKALAPGGTFAYVPGVPFIEAMLPNDKLEIVRMPLTSELLTDSVKRVQEATGLVLDSATHVTARSGR
jgi:hypothetical protein